MMAHPTPISSTVQIPQTLKQLRSAIAQVMAQHKTLNLEGAYRSSFTKTTAEFEKRRQQLVQSLTEIDLCLIWLKDAPLIKTPNQRAHSYHLKHIVEDLANYYVSNGCLIVAAYILKIPMRDHFSPSLAISQKWLKEQELIQSEVVKEKRQPVLKPRFISSSSQPIGSGEDFLSRPKDSRFTTS